LENYISISILVSGLFAIIINILYNYGIERDGLDMGENEHTSVDKYL